MPAIKTIATTDSTPRWPGWSWPAPADEAAATIAARPPQPQPPGTVGTAAQTSRVTCHCSALARFALFRDLPRALLEPVARHACEHRLDEGQALFFKNDLADFLALVLDGRMHEILHGPDGQELIVAAPGPGEAVDESVLLDHGVRSFTAIASIPTRLLLLHRRHFGALVASPLVFERATAHLCLRLRRTIDSLESIGLYRLESRLARYLLSHVAPGDRPGRGADVALPSTQGILAAMLNVSRPKLNAQLRAWQRSGLASRRGNMLHVHDLDQLRDKAYVPARAGHTQDTDFLRSSTRSCDPMHVTRAPVDA